MAGSRDCHWHDSACFIEGHTAAHLCLSVITKPFAHCLSLPTMAAEHAAAGCGMHCSGPGTAPAAPSQHAAHQRAERRERKRQADEALEQQIAELSQQVQATPADAAEYAQLQARHAALQVLPPARTSMGYHGFLVGSTWVLPGAAAVCCVLQTGYACMCPWLMVAALLRLQSAGCTWLPSSVACPRRTGHIAA